MHDKQPLLVLMQWNDQVNESKLLSVLKSDFRPMAADEIRSLTGADAGSIGPIGLNGFRIIADKRLEGGNNLISGANKNDYHIKNIDLTRDAKVDGYFDLRTVLEGESCAGCGTPLRVVKAIELGHVFKLGTKYADALEASFLTEQGESKPIIMGSYGIGVERVIACLIEQSHDDNGIIWSKTLAPYQVQLVLINTKNEEVTKVAESLYQNFQQEKIEVLFDDRKDLSPGFKFKDADLLGMPLHVIVGEKNVVNGNVEIKNRKTGAREIVPIGNVVEYVKRFYVD
jgi:prolyl-tRNA synthetase